MKKCKKRGKEALDEALLKVATGYSVEEVTEEYAEVDGEMKLLKRKETKKDIPPDLKAVQILLADGNADISKMSDEELKKERERLLAELEKKACKKASEEKVTGQVCAVAHSNNLGASDGQKGSSVKKGSKGGSSAKKTAKKSASAKKK